MIKTNTAITVMKKDAVVPSDTESKVVYGEILDVNISFERGGVDVGYSYYTTTVYDSGLDSEWVDKVSIKTSFSFYSFEEMEVIKGLIPAIPEGLTEKEEVIFKYKEALKIKMSERFGVAIVNIDEV